MDGKVDRTLLTADSPALYASPGYLLYRRGVFVMAQPFNPKSAQVGGRGAGGGWCLGAARQHYCFLLGIG
jgi:hypothetical protein